MKPGRSAIAAGFLLLACAASAAEEDPELQAQIVMGCYYRVGEFGAGLVDICVKENLQSARAMADYPKQIVGRCFDRYAGDGWVRVKACADAEIEAGGNK
jgi:hypothetical protein